MPKNEDYCGPTPVEWHGGHWVKRDDRFSMAGICGGKVRGCWDIIQAARTKAYHGPMNEINSVRGLVTASSRKSPQAQIVARLAARLGIAARLHMPSGADTDEMRDVQAHGGTIVRHRPGYNSVICARAVQDAQERGWLYIPFGMENTTALRATAMAAQQLGQNPPDGVKRVVVPLGSGMSAAGILTGFAAAEWNIPVVGVRVGGDPTERIERYGPPRWSGVNFTMVTAPEDYHTEVEASIGNVRLDPVYEAKCMQFLNPGDLLWVVGIRATDGPARA